MKTLFIKRALYNKISDEKQLVFLSTLKPEEFSKKRNICIMGGIKEGNLLELLDHLAFANMFFYQIMVKQGLKSKYNQKVLNYTFEKGVIDNFTINFENLKNLIIEVDDAMVELFENLDMSSLDLENFAMPESRDFMSLSLVTYVEQYFSHQIHHRGQISQILAELNVGEDASRFYMNI